MVSKKTTKVEKNLIIRYKCQRFHQSLADDEDRGKTRVTGDRESHMR